MKLNDDQLQAVGADALGKWAINRANVGFASRSNAEAIARNSAGGASSTAPGRLTSTERNAAKHQATLRVEAIVQGLTEEQRSAIQWKHAQGGSVALWAAANGVSESSARRTVTRAEIEIGRALTRAPRRGTRRRAQ